MAGKRTLKAAKKKPGNKPTGAKKAGTVKKAAPQKAPKKAAPKKASPKTNASVKAGPKKAATGKANPPKGSPKQPAPAKAGPKQAPQATPSKSGAGKALVIANKPSIVGSKPVAPQGKTAGASKPGASKPAGPPSKSGARGGILPPRPSNVGHAVEPRQQIRDAKGETLTLVPARSSSPGLRPRQDPTRSRAPASGAARREAGVTLVRSTSERPSQAPAAALPIPVRKVEAVPTLEERFARIEKRLEALDEETRKRYFFLFDQAWVSHDSALEGTVYTREELEAGFSAEPILTDSSLQPAADEIRRHREAIEYVRDFGQKKRLPVTVDVVKKIFLILHPSEGDLKTVRYRKDIPQHRLYFHEYAAPDKIIYKTRQIIDWLNDPETKKGRSTLRLAARVHYDLLRVFPFQTDSGKVARLFMNLLLYRGGYPPAIIHAKERQSYYEALKGEPNKILRIVQDSVEDGLASIEKLLDEQDARKRPIFS